MALLSLAFSFSAMAATPDWSLHAWQSDDGLPNNNVTGLAQSDDGYLWIANPSRLARFDGARFETFASRELAPELHQKVTTLLRSRTGGMWLGLDRGAVVYLDGGVPRVYTNSLPDEYIQSLLEDGDGAVWVTFPGDTVCRIRDGKVTRFNGADGLPSGYSCWLTRDLRGRLWYAKGQQAGTFEDGRFTRAFELPQPINGITAASDGGLWLASGSHLFHCGQEGQLKDCGAFIGQKSPPQRTPILEDADHAVWIGTADSGLFRYNGSDFENIPTSHREISSLLKDNENNLWAGTGGGGLDRISRRAIELEGTANGLPFEAVQSLCEDVDGVIWATTQNGFLCYRSNGVWQVAMANRTRGGMASCVAADTNGTMWVGTHSSTLNILRDGKVTSADKAAGLAGRVIHALLVTRSGDVWLGEGNPEGVQRYRDGKFTSFPLPPDLRVIRAMVEDQAGNVWVGTSKGVLLRITGDTVFDETTNTTGVPMSIRCLRMTSDGTLWIGYAGFGVGRLKDGHFNRITVEQGLYDFNISQMVPDDRGWMWFGADHGIFKVRRQELDDAAAGRLKAVQCIHYGREEDLPSLQANYGDCPGALQSRDGRLWLPMRTALAVIDPAKVSGNSAPANARPVQVVVDDQPVAAYGGFLPVHGVEDLRRAKVKLHLPPGYRRLEFDFTAPNFSAPENVRFRYCLAGFDNHWIENGTQRSATYSRLAPGTYEFQVAACNGDGVWGQVNTALALTVEPFFWQTWWFRGAAMLGFTLTIIGVVRYLSFRRLRLKLQMLEHQAALDSERARIARDLHDDLGTRLTKIILLSGLVQRDLDQPDRAAEHLDKIFGTARRVIKSLDETVWAINPRNDNLPHLISYVGQYTVEFLQAADIRCRPELPEHPPHHGVPARTRHNVFLALKEALNNIVRHSNAKEVRLSVDATDQWLRIVLEDDGQGFEERASNGCADGLGNMRRRMEEIGGRFEFESRPGTGTRLSFNCPWRNGD